MKNPLWCKTSSPILIQFLIKGHKNLNECLLDSTFIKYVSHSQCRSRYRSIFCRRMKTTWIKTTRNDISPQNCTRRKRFQRPIYVLECRGCMKFDVISSSHDVCLPFDVWQTVNLIIRRNHSVRTCRELFQFKCENSFPAMEKPQRLSAVSVASWNEYLY